MRAEIRGSVWYLSYSENGRRHRPRIGADKQAARQLAAQINAQLESSVPTALSFEPITLEELQRCWLDHHEHVLRSSLQTIRRYRAATNHLIAFLEKQHPGCRTSVFGMHHAEGFVRYLRAIKVAPNGHAKARKRPLLDSGIRFILETCRSMFRFALKRRHLSPYADNPFSELEIDRLPIENVKPVQILTPELDARLLEACDEWQFPIFLTLMFTGLRPGELTHLLLPVDLDLEAGVLRVRNKPRLRWQVKTRNEREIPLLPILGRVLRHLIGSRTTGLVFRRRACTSGHRMPLQCADSTPQLEHLLQSRIVQAELDDGEALSRAQEERLARIVWRDAGLIRSELIRNEFRRLTRRIDLPELTAPKVRRHGFATSLQDANVDPLIRCELMGHSTGSRSASHRLGMTATYTHTRPETRRDQLIAAFVNRQLVRIAESWLLIRTSATGRAVASQ
ncbi:MAG: site-specific integrase [Planctomycetaceae bacterium]